jgi:RHS repeat-associated protein
VCCFRHGDGEPSGAPEECSFISNFLAAPDYQYDAAGNMTYDATASLSYSFDQENRLTGASGYTYTYDGDGNRKSNGNTASSGTLYWAMTPGVVAETDLAGTLKSEYVFFDGERVARRDGATGTGGVFYYFSDHLKTASVVTDSAGNIKAESDYYPWGGELQFVNNDTNDYKFTGKKRDAETGLDYFGARYYSNGLGRWISADWSPKPIPVPYADFGDPQSLNLYGYVRNFPTVRYDIDGHTWEWWQRLVNGASGNGFKTDAQVEQEETKRERDYLIKQQAEIDGKKKDYTKATDKEVKEDFKKIEDAFKAGKVNKLDVVAAVAGGTSPNQMQKQVEKGQAPKSVDRVDSPRFPNEKPHVEFKDGNALNNDGTWKHGGRDLTNIEKDWLQQNGWQLPK